MNNRKWLTFLLLLALACTVTSQTPFAVGATLGSGVSLSSDWGDFNGDGLPDLVVGNVDSHFVYVNEGSGAFSVFDTLFVPGPATVRWVDYDSDLDLDLIVGTSDNNQNHVYSNEGGVLILAQVFQSSSTADIAFGDLDQNGTVELLFSNWLDGNFHVYTFVTASDSLLPVVGYPFGEATSLVVIDIDNDNDLDVIAGKGCCMEPGDVFVNDGGGAFSLASHFGSTSSEMSKIDPGDFDGDGDIDLLVSGGEYPVVEIFLNNGAGEFDSNIYVGSHYFANAAWADFDLDLDLDIIVGTVGAQSPKLLYYQNVDQAFSQDIIEDDASEGLPLLNGTFDVSIADYDNDGDLDLFTGRATWQSEFEIVGANNVLFKNTHDPSGVNRFQPEDHAIQIRAYPSPFNSQVTIAYSLPLSGWVSLELFTLEGRLIWSDRHYALDQGKEHLTLDFSSMRGRELSSGLYLFSIRSNTLAATLKLMYLK